MLVVKLVSQLCTNTEKNPHIARAYDRPHNLIFAVLESRLVQHLGRMTVGFLITVSFAKKQFRTVPNNASTAPVIFAFVIFY